MYTIVTILITIAITITLIEAKKDKKDRDKPLKLDQSSLEAIKEKAKESAEKYNQYNNKGFQSHPTKPAKAKSIKEEKFDDEIEKFISDMYLIGDPDRPMPENDKDMINKMCRNHQKKDEKIREYIRRKYVTSSGTAISAIELQIKAINNKNNDYCATKSSRKDYTDNALEINKLVKALATARKNHINELLASINDDDVGDIKSICCSFWRYKNETIDAIENEDAKGFVVEMIVDYNIHAHTLICRNHKEDSEACELSDKKPKLEWSHSLLSAGLYAVSRTPSLNRR